jgi:protein gp37
MSEHSAIEWTDATWNPTSGCTKVSPGRVGKKAAGRLLDGVEHSAFPSTSDPDAGSVRVASLTAHTEV